MMSVIDLLAIDVETSRIYMGYSLTNNFNELVYMNI